MFNVAFSKPWTVVQPTVHRHLNRQWVDEFFLTGSLLLSSFDAFRKHKDETRLDAQEGRSRYEFFGIFPDGNQAYLNASLRVPDNAWVLCGSMSDSATLAERFRTDGVLSIQDTLAFAEAVAQQIAGFTAGYQGPCIYVDARKFRNWPASPPGEPYPHPSNDRETNRAAVAAHLARAASHFPFFVKSTTFAVEAEYRFIWLTDRPTSGNLIVNVPAARSMCFPDPRGLPAYRRGLDIPDPSEPPRQS